MKLHFKRTMFALVLPMLLASVSWGEALRAVDQPLDVEGVSGQTAEWLKGFAHPQETFTYQVSDFKIERTIRIGLVEFASPFESPFAENNVVPGELYLPAKADGKVPGMKVPGVIVLDILQGNALLPRMMAKWLAREGIAALYISMPYYNDRRPKGAVHERMMLDDPRLTLDVLRQTVMDIRRAKALLASRPEVDPDKIGITGISLGGIMTALAAGVDGHFYRVVPILGGGDLASIVFTAPETRRIRDILPQKGITQTDLAQMLAPVEPMNFASRIRADNCLMINADKDKTILKANTQALANAIGNPQMIWTPLGHIDSAIYLPNILQKTADYFNDRPVDGLQMRGK